MNALMHLRMADDTKTGKERFAGMMLGHEDAQTLITH